VNDLRPPIGIIKSGVELRRWYWLKTELTAEARRVGLKSSGAKFLILERLCHFLDSGETCWPGDDGSPRARSSFDWQGADLTASTVITDNYANTQNVRRFFQHHVDPAFKFNLALMDWIKANVGKTLGDAGRYWQSTRGEIAQIKAHNQFNQYARDFMVDNPTMSMQDARTFWGRKRRLSSADGRHRYEVADLKLTDD
jgi:hypothetical protein